MVAIFYFLVVVFHVMVVSNRMARVVSALTDNSDSLISDGRCKHCTVLRARCTRNIF